MRQAGLAVSAGVLVIAAGLAQGGAVAPRFTRPPMATKVGDGWRIEFAVNRETDVAVFIEDAKGRVVRHLVAGVLGKNPPEPLKANSLEQSIVWDGKDDAGKPVPAGCHLGVSLGLRPVFDRALGWSAAMQDVAGLAVDRRGELYVLGGVSRQAENRAHVRVFDRDGRYLRTIMPHSASVPTDRMTLVEWTRTGWGAPAISRPRSGGARVFEFYRYPGFRSIPYQSPVVTLGGQLGFITGFLVPQWGVGLATPPAFAGAVGRKVVFLDTRDGAAPPGSIVEADQGSPNKAGVLGDGRIFLALSPDGKWLYLGGAERANDVRWGRGQPSHAVCRIALSKPGPAERFLGEHNVPGKDNSHFDQPRGVACDAAGRVYVADYGNDRIQVFQSDGRYVKTLPVRKPDQLAVHPESGEVYVLQAIPEGKAVRMRLLGLGGLEAPRARAALDLPQCRDRVTYVMALDAASRPPALWVSAEQLWRVVDRRDHFEKLFSVQERSKAPEGWESWEGGRQMPYIAADPYREELYVREHGGIVYGSPVLRIDGRTGRVIERLTEPIEQVLGVGPDKLVYMRLAHYPGHKWLVRYDPERRRYVPFPEAESARSEARPGGIKDDFPLGPYVPHGGSRRSYQDQWAVAPNGDIYVLAGPTPEQIAALEKSSLPRPSEGAVKTSRLLQVFSPGGQRRALSALPGLGSGVAEMTCLQVRVARGGAVYLAGMFRPVGQAIPDGLAPDARCLPTFWGTLIKLDSAFDRFPVGRIAGLWEEKLEATPTHNSGGWRIDQGRPIRIDNMLWHYPGIAPVVHEGCTCAGSSFDLDGFERVWVPAVQTCSVNVLDANGNLVMRVGKYGNTDSGGPEPAFIFPRYVTTTDEAAYVEDEENHRIVRLRIRYHAEVRLPLP